MYYKIKNFALHKRHFSRLMQRVYRWFPSLAAGYKTGLPPHRHKLS